MPLFPRGMGNKSGGIFNALVPTWDGGTNEEAPLMPLFPRGMGEQMRRHL